MAFPPVVFDIKIPKEADEIKELLAEHSVVFKEEVEVTNRKINAGQFPDFIEVYKRIIHKAISDIKATTGHKKEDYIELDNLLLDMDTWVFGPSYAKQKLKMCATKRGNSLVFDVMVYAEQPDASYAFKTLKFTKDLSIQERTRHGDSGAGTKTLKAICSLGIWNLVNHIQDEGAQVAEEEMIKKLQNEDIAKYFLAQSCAPTLQREGISINFVAALEN